MMPLADYVVNCPDGGGVFTCLFARLFVRCAPPNVGVVVRRVVPVYVALVPAAFNMRVVGVCKLLMMWLAAVSHEASCVL